MIGSLTKVAGLALMMTGAWAVLMAFGFPSMINPDPPDDWWSRYWANFWQQGGPVGVGVGTAMVAFGGWLVVLPSETRSRPVLEEGH